MCSFRENIIFNRRIFGMCMRIKFTFLTVLIFTGISAKGQQADSITNEELNRYAVMMDSLEALKKQRNDLSIKFAKGNEKITAARYQQLLPIIDDQKKLADSKASLNEVTYVKKALTDLTEEGKKFQIAFTSLMSEYVGYDTYSKVRKAISINPKVKARYEVELYRINGISYSKE